MALELRPSCENCDLDLPPASIKAMICTFECTFCDDCVKDVLHNVCPNCGGGFCQRPVRPKQDHKDGNNLENHPASTKTIHKPVSLKEHVRFAIEIEKIMPSER